MRLTDLHAYNGGGVRRLRHDAHVAGPAEARADRESGGHGYPLKRPLRFHFCFQEADD